MAPKIDMYTSTYERIQLNEGPRVDIYVGAEKKHYSLPKNLLCSSSSYFDRCFNGGFTEGQTQKLTLEEDNVDHWEILLEFMYSGKVETTAVDFGELPDQNHIRQCINFIEYTDKYGLGGASLAVHDCLRRSLRKEYPISSRMHLLATFILKTGLIELVFRVAPPGSKLRTLVARAALASGIDRFKKQESEVHGYPAELLVQLRIGPNDLDYWKNPLQFDRQDWI